MLFYRNEAVLYCTPTVNREGEGERRRTGKSGGWGEEEGKGSVARGERKKGDKVKEREELEGK
jgi:hypothetical protein